MNGNIPVGVGMHAYVSICVLNYVFGDIVCVQFVPEVAFFLGQQALTQICWQNASA